MEGQPERGMSSDTKSMMEFEANKKSVLVAYLLWFFLGGLGVHRLTLGRVVSGLTMAGLFVVGFITSFFLIGVIFLIPLAIWWIVDAFLLPGMVAKENTKLIEKLAAA